MFAALQTNQRLKDCSERQAALAALWQTVVPKPYRITFRQQVTRDEALQHMQSRPPGKPAAPANERRPSKDSEGSVMSDTARSGLQQGDDDGASGKHHGRPESVESTAMEAEPSQQDSNDTSPHAVLLKAIEVALAKAATELRYVHPDMIPTPWMKAEDDDDELWHLFRVDRPPHCDADDAILPLEPLVPLEAKLASVHFEAAIRCKDHEARLHEESKVMNVFVDLTHWDSQGHLHVFDISADEEWGIDELLELVQQMERCLQKGWMQRRLTETMKQKGESSKGGLEETEKIVSQLAYGLRALQRACIKQQLRNVGLDVLEVEKPGIGAETEKELPVSWLAWKEFQALLRCCRRRGAPWLSDQLSKLKLGEPQRVMLISAPNGVLEQAAERKDWMAKIATRKKDKVYIGGFSQQQFQRGAPIAKFWMDIPSKPYPYRPYFQAPLPGLDPHSIISPAERKHLLLSFITDARSEFRFSDGTIDPSRGGADMDPREFITEGIVDNFINLTGIEASKELIQDIGVAKPWTRAGLRRLLQVDTSPILNHFGPEVASYFEFLKFLSCSLLPAAVLGMVVWIASMLLQDRFAGQFLRPSFGLLCPVWGLVTCTLWRRRCLWIAYSWHNGFNKVGTELRSGGTLEDVKAHVRPEFALSFRKRFASLTEELRAHEFGSLRKLLRVDAKTPSAKHFTDKFLAQDLETFNEACYIQPTVYHFRNVMAALCSFVFILLATGTTALSMFIQDLMTEQRIRNGFVSENSVWSMLESFDHKYWAYGVSALAAGIIIPIVNCLHYVVAVWTTDWQDLRMDAEYDSSLFAKLCAFQFFNTFNGLFWVAFIRQDLDQLEVYVGLLTASLMIVGNLQEMAGPLFLSHYEKLRQLAVGARTLMEHSGGRIGFFRGYKLVHTQAFLQGGVSGRSLAEVNHQMAAQGAFSMVEERIELATLFGSIVMFSATMPTLPFIVLVCAVAEIHFDAFKLVKLQRFAGVRAIVGIGMTHHAAVLLSYCGLFVNILVMLVSKRRDLDGQLGKTTMDELFPNSTGREQVLIALLMENIALGLMMFVKHSISEESSFVRDEQYRQKYFENRGIVCREEKEGPAQLIRLRRPFSRSGEKTLTGTFPEEPENMDAEHLDIGIEPAENEDHEVVPAATEEEEEEEQLSPVLE